MPLSQDDDAGRGLGKWLAMVASKFLLDNYAIALQTKPQIVRAKQSDRFLKYVLPAIRMLKKSAFVNAQERFCAQPAAITDFCAI